MLNWENFFIAQVGASAALAGLIFVGVSINLARILSMPRLPNRAIQGLMLLVAVLVISSLCLVPGQALALLGVEVLVIGLTTWTLITVLDRDIMRKTDPRYRKPFVLNIVLSQLATLPSIIAGVVILVKGDSGIYWLVPAVLLSFIKAILGGWVLLVEINR